MCGVVSRIYTGTFACTFFFFNDTATTEIYTLSLHDALPISVENRPLLGILHQRHEAFGLAVPTADGVAEAAQHVLQALAQQDRKSTRLNSSHANISYAVFCLKKKRFRLSSEERHGSFGYVFV